MPMKMAVKVITVKVIDSVDEQVITHFAPRRVVFKHRVKHVIDAAARR